MSVFGFIYKTIKKIIQMYNIYLNMSYTAFLFMTFLRIVDCPHAFYSTYPDSLNTTKEAPYLSEQERAVIFEMNKVRANPVRYANEVIAPFKERFSDPSDAFIYITSDGDRIRTKEGLAAIDECIRVLKSTEPMGMLVPSAGMSKAARAHVADQERSGKTGHSGRDGSTPWKRMERYGKWLGTCGENIDYGNADGVSIIISLLVDDGVSSRGHRKSILNPRFNVVGTAIGSHPQYKHMCVIGYAAGYIEK